MNFRQERIESLLGEESGSKWTGDKGVRRAWSRRQMLTSHDQLFGLFQKWKRSLRRTQNREESLSSFQEISVASEWSTRAFKEDPYCILGTGCLCQSCGQRGHSEDREGIRLDMYPKESILEFWFTGQGGGHQGWPSGSSSCTDSGLNTSCRDIVRIEGVNWNFLKSSQLHCRPCGLTDWGFLILVSWGFPERKSHLTGCKIPALAIYHPSCIWPNIISTIR